ncbi:MAG: hypothetical protein A4E35_02396 [Methanoregula sp. PtaU1.Bin051]|nr:MAG: hypothetical protein A4E35_02396 [Methanoregula sp. PtaU1.Bin051]
MRRISLLAILIMVSILVCGCIQTPAKPAAPTSAPPEITPVQVTSATPVHKQIDCSAWKTDRSVILKCNGGNDASSLKALRVQIDNQNGQVVKRTLGDPVVGNEYEFPYTVTPDPVTINVVGVFSDGTEQTVLLKYF